MTQNQLAILIEETLGDRKPGEWELKRFLRKQGYNVEDVSSNPGYWYKDIDLIVNDKFTLEVKWDSRIAKTKNLFIETCSNIDTKADGWYLFCQAQYLCYGDSRNETFYIFDFKKLKAHIEAHKTEYQVKKAPDYSRQGQLLKWSEGYIVPLESLQGLYKAVCVRGLY